MDSITIKILRNIENILFSFFEVSFINTIKIFSLKFKIIKKPIQISFKKNDIKYHLRDIVDAKMFVEHMFTEYYGFSCKGENLNIIDCGAHIGIETFRLMSLLKKNNNINAVCVEANANNFKYLKKNLGSLSNISFYNNVIHHTDNEYFSETPDNKLSSDGYMYAKTDTEEKNVSISINKLVKINKFKKIDILKIDIENSERELFKKNTEWLGIVDCIIFEYYHISELELLKKIINLIKFDDYVMSIFKENIIFKRKVSKMNFEITRGFKGL